MGAEGGHGRVRDGNGWIPSAMATGTSGSASSHRSAHGRVPAGTGAPRQAQRHEAYAQTGERGGGARLAGAAPPRAGSATLRSRLASPAPRGLAAAVRPHGSRPLHPSGDRASPPRPPGHPGGRSRPRPIRTRQLNVLPRVHLGPIYLVVYQGSYLFRDGDLILGRASRLDAFSAYPVPTPLPSHAPGGTTGTREVGPPRSSRTRGGAPQVSHARDG